MVIEPGSNFNPANSSANRSASAKTEAKTVDSHGSSAAGANSSPDQVSLSVTGQTIANLEAKVSSSSEVNSQKVADIKASLNSGSYEINTTAIAGKIAAEENLFG